MRAKIGLNSGALSGLPATLVKTWMPHAPRLFTARSISASEASTLFIGSAAMNAGKRSGCRRHSSASASLASRASSGVWSGGRDQLERRIGEREHLLQPVELVEQGKPRIDVPQRLEPRKGGDAPHGRE